MYGGAKEGIYKHGFFSIQRIFVIHSNVYSSHIFQVVCHLLIYDKHGSHVTFIK